MVARWVLAPEIEVRVLAGEPDFDCADLRAQFGHFNTLDTFEYSCHTLGVYEWASEI